MVGKMERGKVKKTFHGNMNPKSSPTLRDRDAPFSTHLRPDQLNKCEQHHTIRPGQFTAPDHDSTPELSIFKAHKYFNEVTNNSSNSRVSPLVNMNSEHKHNPERESDITKTSRSYSFASSSVDGYANIRNYRAHSFHAAAPTVSSSEASRHSQDCLVPHPPTSAVSVSTTRNSLPPHKSTNLNTKTRALWSKSIWLLRRKCPCCSCKKSVQVDETTSKPKPKTPITTPPPPLPQPQPQTPSLNPMTPTSTTKLERDHMETVNCQRIEPALNKVRRPFPEGFTFPALATTSSPGQKHVLNVVHEEDPMPPRYSLEVFQPNIVDRDHRRQNLPSPPSPKSRSADIDDSASDASSDLFEIESFSTQAATLPCPIAISECHEPKHAASVELCFAGDTRSRTMISGSECVAAVVHRRGPTTSTTTALQCQDIPN